MHEWAGVCRGARARIEVKKQALQRPLHVPPSNHPTPFGNGCGGSRLRDGDYSTTRVGSEWALGSRNEGYSRRGGFSAASVFSGPSLAQYCTSKQQPIDDASGGRMMTPSAVGSPRSPPAHT